MIRTQDNNSWGYFDPSVPTLADRLAAAGYHTGIIGKWHLGLRPENSPTARGFDHFHGFLGDMMDDYRTHRREGFNYMRLQDGEIDPPGHATELFSQWAVDYMKSRKDTEQPFFMYLAFNAPHFPIQPPADWVGRAAERLPAADEKRIANVAFVEHVDHHVGVVLDAIDSLGLADNTAVILTSDNGGSVGHAQSNVPWRGGKQDHYDGGLKVPFVARVPGVTDAGSHSDYQGLTFDAAATFLELAGAAADDRDDAVSLIPELSGEEMPGDRELYFVRREGNRQYGGEAYHAIIADGHKLMRNRPGEPYQLFDLTADPGEQVDLIDRRRRVADDLQKRLMRHIQAGGQTAWQKSLP